MNRASDCEQGKNTVPIRRLSTHSGPVIWLFKAVVVADAQKSSGCGLCGAGAGSEGTVEGPTAGGTCLLSNDGHF